MARFNLFEGSRRIALLLKVVWLISCAVVAYFSSPSIYLHFSTDSPRDVWHVAPDTCRIGTDGTEFSTVAIEPGKTVSAQLCFKAQTFQDQRELVPYKFEADGTMWGNGPYSPEVAAYTKARERSFALDDTARQDALAEWNKASWANWRMAVYVAVGGWIGFSILQSVVGWIVRGFMGIPRGHDHRPEAAPPVAPAAEQLE